ncbi:MAG TPA: Zn-ribbon domain-containing OB-fold protein [Thermodesulfobacteriota bacterium]|nr:Zn-ribbon domain-containing OB-fold protein [Thermodesulfobacteriota bacterium]
MSTVKTSPDSTRKQVSINDKLFKLPSPGEEPRLTGVKCRNCGELFFPKRTKCIKCFAEDMEEISLSEKGKVYSYTIVHHATPGYTGTLPYAVGAVELPGGIVVLSPLTQCRLDQLKIGMDVELVLEKLYEDENGNEVISYKFRPC